MLVLRLAKSRGDGAKDLGSIREGEKLEDDEGELWLRSIPGGSVSSEGDAAPIALAVGFIANPGLPESFRLGVLHNESKSKAF